MRQIIHSLYQAKEDRLLLNLSDKISLKKRVKYIVLSNFTIYYTRKKFLNTSKSKNFKISGPRWKNI